MTTDESRRENQRKSNGKDRDHGLSLSRLKIAISILISMIVTALDPLLSCLLFYFLVFVYADIESMQSPYGSSVFEKASSRSVFLFPVCSMQ